MMNTPYLEITYRQGRPFAAYLYLSRRPGDRSVRTDRKGLFLIDYTAEGKAIGIEFTTLGGIDVAAVNRLLTDLHETPLSAEDLAPLIAA